MAVLLIIFLFGLGVGSFLNVVIIRGKQGTYYLGGRSRCVSCRIVLSPTELIPLASFFIQKGRCKHCGSTLSWQYPLVEFLTALLYVFAWQLALPYFLDQSFGVEHIFLLLAIFAGIGAAIVIFVSDIRYRIVPDNAVLILAGIGAIVHIFYAPSLSAFLGAFIIALVLTLFWACSKGIAMGLGDAKLIFATSLIIGYPASLVAFLFSFWLGGVVGVLLIASGKKTFQDQIPFGPFIVTGTALAYFLGEYFLAISGLQEFV